MTLDALTVTADLAALVYSGTSLKTRVKTLNSKAQRRGPVALGAE